jgi:CBS domain-containing protein
MATSTDLLREKDAAVYTVSMETDVLEAVRQMNRHRIGALVVLHGGRVAGMFTERDVLRLVDALRDLAHLRVGDVMTRNIATIEPCTEVDDIQEMMRTRRVRHLPVIADDGRLVGMVSIGDVNAWCVAQQAAQLEGLTEYIHGRA